MNKQDILKMTREAHLDVYGLGKDHQKFMAAVECVAYSAFTAGALAEREACAKVCEELEYDGYEMLPRAPRMAKLIRARGNGG